MLYDDRPISEFGNDIAASQDNYISESSGSLEASDQPHSSIETHENQAKEGKPDHIHPLHWRELMDSGISPEIASINFRTLNDPVEVNTLLNRSDAEKHDGFVPGWAAQGIDLKGRKTLDGAQYKPNSPRQATDANGKARPGKFRKYESRSGVGASPLFLDSGIPSYWRNVANDVNTPIIITEGAKKAGAGLTAGYAVISIPGVTTGQKEGVLKPDLVPFCQPGRTIYLCFDNDLETNPNVCNALEHLSKLLRVTGVTVKKVILPPGEAKGLDDFLVVHGKESFARLVSEAEAFTGEIFPKSPNKNGSNDELKPLIDQADWAAELAALREDENQKAEIADLRIDDEAQHPQEFYLYGIWEKLYGGQLWNTMLNRHPALVSTIMTYLMGTVPLNLQLMSPSSGTVIEAPTLFTSVYGASGKGKGAIFSLLKRSLLTAISKVDDRRCAKQRRFVKGLQDQRRAKDKNEFEGELTDFNRSLEGIIPLIHHGDTTPQAFKRCVAAQEAYAVATDGDLMATSQLIAHSEAQQFIEHWSLCERRGSYASVLNGYWSNEVASSIRSTDAQFYRVKSGITSLSLMMTSDQMLDLLDAEKPQKGRRAMVNGLSARLQCLEILKDPTKPEPKGRASEKDEHDRFYLESECTEKLETAIEKMQLLLNKQERMRWADDALEAWEFTEGWIKEVRSLHSTGTWIAYCEKLPANLVRLAFAARLMRLIDQLASGEKIGRIEVEDHDAFLGATLLRLFVYDRYHCELLSQQQSQRSEAEKIESRSLRQQDDVWYRRFADPGLLKGWVEVMKDHGCRSVSEITKKVSSEARKRLLTRYGINVSDSIRQVF